MSLANLSNDGVQQDEVKPQFECNQERFLCDRSATKATTRADRALLYSPGLLTVIVVIDDATAHDWIARVVEPSVSQAVVCFESVMQADALSVPDRIRESGRFPDIRQSSGAAPGITLFRQIQQTLRANPNPSHSGWPMYALVSSVPGTTPDKPAVVVHEPSETILDRDQPDRL
jgi:hypothetical protein